MHAWPRSPPLILIVALAGVLLRPRDIHESTFAALGAIAMLRDGSRAARRRAWHVLRSNLSVLAFLAGVLVLAAAADEAGWFAEGARLAVRGARGSPLRLFAGVCIVSFAGSVLFSLDAAAVALTPVVLIAARRAGATAEPLLFACIAVANTASMALPVSNPTNVIVADRVGLDFVDYARTMLPPAIARLARGLARARASASAASSRGRLAEPASAAGIDDRGDRDHERARDLARARRASSSSRAISARSPSSPAPAPRSRSCCFGRWSPLRTLRATRARACSCSRSASS